MDFTEAGLLEAIREDHPCTEQSCDIAAAAKAGYVFSAAHLLMGATETPAVNAYLEATGFSIYGAAWSPRDWDEWYQHHLRYGVKCTACNAFNYGDDSYTPETCGNCLAPLEEPARCDCGREVTDEAEIDRMIRHGQCDACTPGVN